MQWVTRRHIRVNRTATAWLIRRFIDPDASFSFVDPELVSGIEREKGAVGFDAPGARYPHKDARGHCSFEALVEEHCPDDATLQRMARIVHCADFPEQLSQVAEAAGLNAISRGFPLVASDDHETVDRAAFLYDALYAGLAERLSETATPREAPAGSGPGTRDTRAPHQRGKA